MGSRLVQDINPAGSSSPNELISLNGLLFFSAELGAPASTNTGASESEGSEISGESDSSGETDSETADSDSSASATETGSSSGAVGLIRSDGTNEGTTILKTFDSVTNIVRSGDQLYFIAEVGNQYQLWTSNGTTRGTKQVKDLYPGADSRFPQDLFEIDGVLFYSAIDGTGDNGKYPFDNGYEVWRKEGDSVGSRFFRNLIPDKLITDISYAEETGEGDETPVQQLLDENGDPVFTEIEQEVPVTGPDGKPVMVDSDPPTYTLVDVIGPDGQPVMVDSDPPELIQVPVINPDGSPALDGTGTPIKEYVVKQVPKTEYVVDQVPLTEIVTVTVPVTEPLQTATVETAIFENDSFPKDFVGLNGNYFFTAESSAYYTLETRNSDVLIGGLELWFSDGTEAGTRPININENTYTFYEPDDGKYTPSNIVSTPQFGFNRVSSSSFPRELTPAKDRLYFVANDGITGFELWSISDQGTKLTLISDLHPGNTGSSPEDLTIVGKNLYFSADDGNGRKLYYFNRSMDEPSLVKRSGENPESLTAIGNKLFYSAESDLGRELWSAKRSSAKLLKDINPGSESSSPEHFTMTKRVSGSEFNRKKKNYLYFSANDGTHGTELMSLKAKGKRNKVNIESDINEGPSSSIPRELTVHDQQLFFTAKDPDKGRELWTVGPSIKGPGGADGASKTEVFALENQTFVYQFSDNATEKRTWSINGGKDSSQFKINSNTGVLSFKKAPDFEKPRDANKDGIYDTIALHNYLVQLKKQHAKEKTIVLEPKVDLDYEMIVKIMDAIRMLDKTDEEIYIKDKDGIDLRVKELFNKIVFGNLMS